MATKGRAQTFLDGDVDFGAVGADEQVGDVLGLQGAPWIENWGRKVIWNVSFKKLKMVQGAMYLLAGNGDWIHLKTES
jgi:hypothetical protein